MSQTCRSGNVIKGFSAFPDRTRRPLARLLLLINEQLDSIPTIITSSVNYLLALFSHYAPSFSVYAVMLTVVMYISETCERDGERVTLVLRMGPATLKGVGSLPGLTSCGSSSPDWEHFFSDYCSIRIYSFANVSTIIIIRIFPWLQITKS